MSAYWRPAAGRSQQTLQRLVNRRPTIRLCLGLASVSASSPCINHRLRLIDFSWQSAAFLKSSCNPPPLKTHTHEPVAKNQTHTRTGGIPDKHLAGVSSRRTSGRPGPWVSPSLLNSLSDLVSNTAKPKTTTAEQSVQQLDTLSNFCGDIRPLSTKHGSWSEPDFGDTKWLRRQLSHGRFCTNARHIEVCQK